MNHLIFEVLTLLCEATIIGSQYLNLLHPKLKIWHIILLWNEIVFLGIVLTPPFSFIRIGLIAILELVVIIFSFEDKLTIKIYRFFLAEVASALSACISYFLVISLTNFRISFTEICACDNCTYNLLYIVILSIMSSMLFQYAKKVRSVELPWVFGTQLVIGAGESCAILAYANSNGGVISKGNSSLFIISVVCLVITNLSVGILSSLLIQTFNLNRSIDFGNELSNMEYKYYEISVENNKKIQLLKHDIANQIQTVYSLIVNGESQKGIELIDELRDRYGQVDQLIYCENPVLNIILANKKAEAEKNEIEVQIKVRDFPKQLPISDFDISTVVCNLFDNAIRGCICSNQSHPRLIVEIVKKNKYLVIRILNSCNVNMNIENTDKIESTKSNSQTHGFGMPIVAGIVKRHKGDFVVSAQNGLFTATAIMSIN